MTLSLWYLSCQIVVVAALPCLFACSLARGYVGRLFLAGLLDALGAGVERSLALADRLG